MKDIYEVIKSHRSIRKYKNEDIPDSDLEKILSPAIHSPTSINGQQFSILVIKDKRKKEKLSELTGNQPWVAKAPVFLVFLSDFSRIAKTMEKRNVEFKNIDSIESTLVGAVDCGIAFGSVMNIAESMGYGIVPIGAIRRKPNEVIELLNLPKYVYPIVGMCIGIPDENPGIKPRFEFNNIVHKEEYRPLSESELEEYDKKVEKYMEKRTEGKDIRSWSDLVSMTYSNIYFPEVNSSLKNQGYKNNK